MSTTKSDKSVLDVQAFKENERLAWDLCAEKYDRCLTDPFAPFAEKVATLAHLEPGLRVLDVATGSGLAALIAARLVGPEGHVLGVDLSETMIELARKRATRDGVANVDFLQMDAEELEQPSGSYDVVLCALGLMLFPQPERALAEMHRVLRDGGVAVLSVFGRGSRVALRALMDPFIQYMPPAPQRGPSIFAFGRSDTLEQALKRAGFCDVNVEQQSHVLAFDTPDSVWEMLLSLGRLAQMHARLPAEAQAQLKQRVFQIAEDRYSSSQGALELPFELTYVLARR